VPQVLGEVDGRHAAFAEVALDPVAVGEGGREPGGDLAHGAKMGHGWRFGEVLSPQRASTLALPPSATLATR
jgi:hypothetical protein